MLKADPRYPTWLPVSVVVAGLILSSLLLFYRPGVSIARLAGDTPPPVDAITSETVDQLSPLARLGQGRATDAAYADQGRFLIVGTTLGAFWYDAATLEQTRLVQTASPLVDLAISPDQSLAAWVLDDYSVAVAQADAGDLIDTFAEEGFYAEGLAFAPAGDLLALVSRASLKLWRPGEPTALRTLIGDPDTLLKDVAFSPDGQFVAASAWYTDLIQLWSVATGEPTMVLSLDSGIAQSLAFSPDGSLLAAGMFDGSIRLWSLTDGRQTATLQGPASPIGKLVFSPDGQTLAVGGQAGQLTLWAIADQQSRSLPQQTAAIHSLTYAADGRQLLVVLEDGLTQHWQLSDGTLLGEIGQHQLAQVNALAFTPDGSSLTAGSTDGGLRTWSLRDESLVGLTPATGSVDAVAFSADGRFLLSAMRRWLSEAGTWDDTVHLRQASDHAILQTLGGDRYPKSVCNGIYVNRAVFSPHGDVVATASHDQIIRLWRVADGSLLASLTGHALIITELAFSPDGRLLASSAEDGEVRLWSMATYEPVRTLPPHASGAASLTFSPNGKTLATADGAGRLHLWRVADGQPLWTVDSGKNYHSNLTFSPDGSLLAAGADDEQLHFWAAQDGALRYTLSGPLAEVKRVAFSPDGRQVAAGSVDGTVRLWAIPGRSEAQAVGLKVEAD